MQSEAATPADPSVAASDRVEGSTPAHGTACCSGLIRGLRSTVDRASARLLGAGRADKSRPPEAMKLAAMVVLAALVSSCGVTLDPKVSSELPAVLREAVLFKTFGGLGLFFLGLNLMETGLRAAAADKLKNLLKRVTDSRISGLATGTLITSIIQSSSVTTVMLVGLVSAGLMTLKQSMGVVFGANIGTTMTGWLFAFKVTEYGLPITGIGALLTFFLAKLVKKERAERLVNNIARPGKARNTLLGVAGLFSEQRVESVGRAILGVGLVFIGLTTMSSGFNNPVVKEVLKTTFASISGTSHLDILVCIVVAAIATEIVQSSSASLGVIIALSITGVIPFATSVALVIGINIGTTITAVLAAIRPGTPRAAQRVAASHVGFNVIGAALIFAVAPQYIHAIDYITNQVAVLSEAGAKVAFSHTAFNVLMSVVFTAALTPYERLVTKLLPDKPVQERTTVTSLNTVLLRTPEYAVDASRKEIVNMGVHVRSMLADLRTVILSPLTSEANQHRIVEGETRLDDMQIEIFHWLGEVMQRDFGEGVAVQIDAQRTIADQYETISDRIRDIMRKYAKWQSKKFDITEEAKNDIVQLHDRVAAYIELINSAIEKSGTHVDIEFWDTAVKERGRLSSYIKKLAKKHDRRVRASVREEVIEKIGAPAPTVAPHVPSTEAEPDDATGPRLASDSTKIRSPELKGSTYYMDIVSFYKGIVDRAINIADAVAGKR